MNDLRTSFDEAVAGFRTFLRQQGWSDMLLWLSRDRVTRHGSSLWLFRPEELTSDVSSRRFYEHARKANSSVRIDALCPIGAKTLAYVEDFGGASRLLNFGIHRSPRRIRIVSSSFVWFIVIFLCRIRGETPFIRETRMARVPNHEAEPA
jgi:hypothetical protein